MDGQGQTVIIEAGEGAALAYLGGLSRFSLGHALSVSFFFL